MTTCYWSCVVQKRSVFDLFVQMDWRWAAAAAEILSWWAGVWHIRPVFPAPEAIDEEKFRRCLGYGWFGLLRGCRLLTGLALDRRGIKNFCYSNDLKYI